MPIKDVIINLLETIVYLVLDKKMSSDENAQKKTTLDQRFVELAIREEDLQEKFIRASGPGGQKVNKTSSAVYLKHEPTGIEVKVQSERSQAQNRQLARRLLADRIAERIENRRREEEQQKARLERQRRSRPRHIKEKILEAKHRQSDKKRLRKRVNTDDK